MAKLGKTLPDKFNRPSRDGTSAEVPPVKDPEELKRIHEDMINKQKDFLTHRKEVRVYSFKVKWS